MIKDIKTNELASFLGKSKGWASSLKNGKKKLPLNECFRVSDRFGIPLHELRSEFPTDNALIALLSKSTNNTGSSDADL
jgi:hypothetical protein